jgi:Histidine kinase
MIQNDFFLSDKASYRLARQGAFWLIYSFCYFIQSIPTESFRDLFAAASLQHAAISLLCFLPACILSVSFFVAVLLPLLQKKRYVLLMMTGLLFGALLFVLNYFVARVFAGLVCSCQPEPLLTASGLSLYYLNLAYLNTSFALSISLIAFAIKLAKTFYLQQKENLALAKEKVKNELHLLKARVDPQFLFQTMDILKNQISRGAEESPKLVLKLSDLMSYILYDCNEETVPLDKELSALQDLISIEQIKQNNRFTVHTQVKGDTGPLCIAPLLLLPLLQNALLNDRPGEPLVIYLRVGVTENELDFRLSHNGTDNHWADTIANVRSRLDATYAGYYFFEVKEEEQGTELTLQLELPYSAFALTDVPEGEVKLSFGL